MAEDIFSVKPGTIRVSKRDVGTDSAKDYHIDHKRRHAGEITDLVEEVVKRTEEFNPITDFLPAMAGQAGKPLVVNGAANGVEYGSFPSGYSDEDAIDAVFPGGFAGLAKRLVKVKDDASGLDASGLEFDSGFLERVGNVPFDLLSNDALDGAADVAFTFKSAAAAPHASSILARWGISDGGAGITVKTSILSTGAVVAPGQTLAALGAMLRLGDPLYGLHRDGSDIVWVGDGAFRYSFGGGTFTVGVNGVQVTPDSWQLTNANIHCRMVGQEEILFESTAGALDYLAVTTTGIHVNRDLQTATDFTVSGSTADGFGYQLLLVDASTGQVKISTHASLPGLSGIDDPDTGLGWGAAANVVVAYAGGSEAWRWSTAGIELFGANTLRFGSGGPTVSNNFGSLSLNGAVEVTGILSPAQKIQFSGGFGTQAIQWGGGQFELEYTSADVLDLQFGGTTAVVRWADSSGMTLNVTNLPFTFSILADTPGSGSVFSVSAAGDGGDGTVSFFNVAGAGQAAHIPDPSGGAIQDAESRTAIAAINVVLENLGLVATS